MIALLSNRKFAFGTLAAAAAVVVAGLLMRGDPVHLVILGILELLWFTLVPGILLLSLFDAGPGSRLRFFVLAQAFGLALVALFYSLLEAAGLWTQYGLIQSGINILLLFLVYVRGNGESFRTRLTTPVPTQTLVAVALLLLMVGVTVAVREFPNLRQGALSIPTRQENDALALLGYSAGLKNYGAAVDMYESAIPVGYHYFAYLLVALVNTYSGLQLVAVFQTIIPLFALSLLSISAFYVARDLSGSTRVGLLSGVFVLFLDDLQILNQLGSVIFGDGIQQYMWGTQNVAQLHASPSWSLSLFLAMALLGELMILQRARSATLVQGALFVTIASVLPGYKVPTWMCLVGGMGLASLFYFRKRRDYFLIALLSGIGGLGVLQLTIGRAKSTVPVTNRFILGYPVLRNYILEEYLKFDRYITLSELTPKLVLVIAVLIPLWLLLTYGARFLWIAPALLPSEKRQPIGFLGWTVLLSSAAGIAVTLFATPDQYSYVVYWFSRYGMIVSIPFTAWMVYRYTGSGKMLTRIAVLTLVLLQIGSGVIYVVKPLLKPEKVAVVPVDFEKAMAYLREQTPRSAKVASNRFDAAALAVNRDLDFTFEFLPALSERAAVGGRQHFGGDTAFNREMKLRRQAVEELFGTHSPDRAATICDTLGVSFVVIDSWKSYDSPLDSMACFRTVFTNERVKILEFDHAQHRATISGEILE